MPANSAPGSNTWRATALDLPGVTLDLCYGEARLAGDTLMIRLLPAPQAEDGLL